MSEELVEIIARAIVVKCYSEDPDKLAPSQDKTPAEPWWVYETDTARAALTALSEAGYVVVPKEPTQDMADACWNGSVDWDAVDAADDDGVKSIYRAMISASPLSKKEG